MNVKIADRIKNAVVAVVTLLMVYALFVSRDHITDVGYRIGLHGYQAESLFVLVDVVALIGKALMLKYFSPATRNMGRNLMITSGLLSLVCNVASGWLSGGYGTAGYGVFIVVMFLVLENVVTKIKPSAAVTRAKNAASAPTAPRKRKPRKGYTKRGPKTSTTTTAAPVSATAPAA